MYCRKLFVGERVFLQCFIRGILYFPVEGRKDLEKHGQKVLCGNTDYTQTDEKCCSILIKADSFCIFFKSKILFKTYINYHFTYQLNYVFSIY